MIRLLLFLIVIILVQLGCKTGRCVVNEPVLNEFLRNLNIVKNAEENNSEFLVDEYRNALIYLGSVTQIWSKAEYSHAIGYKNKSNYEKDMILWRHWLDKNKCKLTRKYVDSVTAIKSTL